MFVRARRRLSLLYVVLFAIVLGLFSVVFYAFLATVLAPTFDIAPENSNAQAADIAYRATVQQIGIALVVAYVLALAIVGVAAWLLAARTLKPIRDAHARQRRFVADASHEMRSPIAAIRSSAEAALSGPSDETELRRALEVVAEASQRLTAVTADLLLLARADEGTLEPRLDTFDLSVLVAETVDAERAERGPDAPAAHVELEPDVVVRADQEEVGRVIRNLLDNAFRYGPPGVQVRVRTRRSEREAIVEVLDDGPGIAAADLEHLFEPFYRVRADAGAPPGSGLGLAIAARLSTHNGGRLAVQSRPGIGSTFRLVLSRFR
jgi:signal transduction histidine kinase